MSTKIYNGYRLVGIKNLRQLDLKFRTFRKVVEAEATTLFHRRVASIATNIIDNVAVGRKNRLKVIQKDVKVQPHTYTPLAALRHGLDAVAEAKRSTRRSPVWDFSCKITVHPLQGGELLAVLYAEQRVFHQLWEDQRWVEHFPYWNNTDPPDGVGWREWSKRGRIWDRALWNHYTASLSGFTVDCVTQYLPWLELKDYCRRQPTFKQRVDRLASLAAVDHDPVESYAEWVKWTRSYAYKRLKKKLKGEIEPKLKKRLAQKDFKQKFGPKTVEFDKDKD